MTECCLLFVIGLREKGKGDLARACGAKNTEHAGTKKGRGAYWGRGDCLRSKIKDGRMIR
ncbi:MAG: hypothetical protein HY957_06945 [Nitrospirae bacterium]|nr:hypothetical protein [Nitrospirota bacterium]